MKGFLIFALAGLAVAAPGCGSDDTNGPGDAAAVIGDLRVELPCLSSGTSGVNCYIPDADEESAKMKGEEGTDYLVTIRLRGVVEQKTYSDYTGSDGMWISGGTPDGGTWNIFSLEVSDPPQIYYLNSGSSGIDHCWELDITKTIAITNGAALTLFAGSGGDALGTVNIDYDDVPIVISGVAPYPYAFDGQFVQMDVVQVEKDKAGY